MCPFFLYLKILYHCRKSPDTFVTPQVPSSKDTSLWVSLCLSAMVDKRGASVNGQDSYRQQRPNRIIFRQKSPFSLVVIKLLARPDLIV